MPGSRRSSRTLITRSPPTARTSPTSSRAIRSGCSETCPSRWPPPSSALSPCRRINIPPSAQHCRQRQRQRQLQRSPALTHPSRPTSTRSLPLVVPPPGPPLEPQLPLPLPLALALVPPRRCWPPSSQQVPAQTTHQPTVQVLLVRTIRPRARALARARAPLQPPHPAPPVTRTTRLPHPGYLDPQRHHLRCDPRDPPPPPPPPPPRLPPTTSARCPTRLTTEKLACAGFLPQLSSPSSTPQSTA